MRNAFKKIVIFIIVMQLLVLCACGSTNNPSSINDSGDITSDIIEQDMINQDIITQDVLNQVITKEIYMKELLIVEDNITEILLQEDRIEEVLLCQTIYVAQDNIAEFSNNSKMASLFGEGIDLKSLLTKVAIGTGVIVTLVVLAIADLEGPVGSIVAAAAPEALKGAAIGTGIGTLVGGLTGATDGVDESGRSSAVLGFALATAGVVLSAISVVAIVYSGGSSAAGVAFGVKLVIAGVGLVAATATAVKQGIDMVKTLTTTDNANIDWKNVDWDKVGVSAAQQSINGAANGYMWGSIIGAVKGGAEGLDYYEKHGTPYSSYKARIDRTPINSERGQWTGERGESTYVLKEPITCKNGKVITEITYKNGVPDFSKYALRQVRISTMTDNRYGSGGNFEQADTELASYWSKTKYLGKEWSPRDVSNYRYENNLTWHEMNNMHSMQLVPTEVNSTFGHLGGVSEYKTMIGLQGGSDFD